MAKHYDEIRRLGGEVAAVSFAKPERVRAFAEAHPLPFPVFSDPHMAGYRAFDLGRTSWREMLAPRVLWRYLKMMFRGWLPGRVDRDDDLLQLGGDFVLGRDGQLLFAHQSSEPTDRPPVNSLIQAVRRGAG
ncbi:MAG: hypothetical protein KatS3mg105_2445 [Gemmatales bacterium]|nr:MAG: hypothetical protein KatS3mg105_2445 [Gemmatales bacterium]